MNVTPRWRVGLTSALAIFIASCSAPPAPDGQAVAVPYRLSPTKHVMVRMKLNGKGPFNLVLDTGAPVLIMSKAVQATTGIQPDANGWATADTVDIEGGITLKKQTVRFEDIFQLEGMNGLGLSGQEIHGLAGFPILARFRIEYDFSQPTLAWTRLDFEPAELPRRAGGGGHAGLNAIGSAMKGVGTLFGLNKPSPPQRRAFLGLTVQERDGAVVVAAVMDEGPAAQAELKLGDVVERLNDKPVKNLAEFEKAQASLKAGDLTSLTVRRSGQSVNLSLTPRGGF